MSKPKSESPWRRPTASCTPARRCCCCCWTFPFIWADVYAVPRHAAPSDLRHSKPERNIFSRMESRLSWQPPSTGSMSEAQSDLDVDGFFVTGSCCQLDGSFVGFGRRPWTKSFSFQDFVASIPVELALTSPIIWCQGPQNVSVWLGVIRGAVKL